MSSQVAGAKAQDFDTGSCNHALIFALQDTKLSPIRTQYPKVKCVLEENPVQSASIYEK